MSTVSHAPLVIDGIRIYPGTESSFVQVSDFSEILDEALMTRANRPIAVGECVAYLGSRDDVSAHHVPIDRPLVYQGIIRTPQGHEIACFLPEPNTCFGGWFLAFEIGDLMHPGCIVFRHPDGASRYVLTNELEIRP